MFMMGQCILYFVVKLNYNMKDQYSYVTVFQLPVHGEEMNGCWKYPTKTVITKY